MNGRRLPLLLAAANVAVALAVWTRRPWANGPAEWRWEYLSTGGLEPSAAAWLIIAAALAGLGILWGHRRLAAWRGAPLAAVVCGAAFTFALVAIQPGGFARVTGALVSRNSFGYVWDAALAPSTRALLADYPAASADLNQHSLTHPPGPLLAVRALGWLDRVLPPPAGARAAADAGTNAGGERGSGLPALAAAAIEREVARAISHGRPVPEPPPGPWAVAALAVLLPALSALVAWPLYLLARRLGQSRETALLAAVMWLLVPARSLFTPSFDQALPVLLVGAAWLAAGDGRVRAAAAGVLLFAACFASYGCLAALPLVAACAAAAPLAAARRDRPEEHDAAGAMDHGQAGDRASGRAVAGGLRQHLEALPWRRWGALALGFTLPYLALAALAGHDPWHALRTALALHHQIAVAPRSYATWLLWNPYDLALLLSPGVLGLAAAALRPGAWRRESGTSPGAVTARLAAGRLAAWTWWGLLALVLLSGGVRGEAGRIWLFWMPFACLFAAAAAAASGGPRKSVALLLATEAALTLALAASLIFVSSS
jgi:hypothetical protein